MSPKSNETMWFVIRAACLVGLLFPSEAFVATNPRTHYSLQSARSPRAPWVAASVSTSSSSEPALVSFTDAAVSEAELEEHDEELCSLFSIRCMEEHGTAAVEEAAVSRVSPIAKVAAGSAATLAVVGLIMGLKQLPLGYLYKAFPIPAAMITCTIKACGADSISQIQHWRREKANTPKLNWCWRRTLSGVIYGALVTGLGSCLVYTKLMPLFISPSLGNSWQGMVIQSAMDNFLFAPLLWVPGAYAAKGLVMRRNELKTYIRDVREEGILQKYWSLWFPAQMITFSVIPHHLRTLSTAAIGFCWFIILTNLTYKNTASADTASA